MQATRGAHLKLSENGLKTSMSRQPRRCQFFDSRMLGQPQALSISSTHNIQCCYAPQRVACMQLTTHCQSFVSLRGFLRAYEHWVQPGAALPILHGHCRFTAGSAKYSKTYYHAASCTIQCPNTKTRRGCGKLGDASPISGRCANRLQGMGVLACAT